MRVVDGDGSTTFSSGATYNDDANARTGAIISMKVATGGAAVKKRMLAGLLAQRAMRI